MPAQGVSIAVPSAGSDTGWVTALPSILSAVIEGAPCTVSTSPAGVPGAPIAGCFAAVAAPAGSGRLAALTGCVAGRLATETAPMTFDPVGSEPDRLTGSVAASFR